MLRQWGLQHWLFFGAMLAMAVAAGFAGEMFESASVEDAISWKVGGLAAHAVGAGLWFCFSLVFARGTPENHLRKYRWALASALLVPLVLLAFFGKSLITVVADGTPQADWRFTYSTAGKLLNGFLLLTYVAVLMNLEATFRASVGTILLAH